MHDPVITITSGQLNATFWVSFIGFVLGSLFALWKRSRIAENRHDALRETVKHLEDYVDRTRTLHSELRDRVYALEKPRA